MNPIPINDLLCAKILLRQNSRIRHMMGCCNLRGDEKLFYPNYQSYPAYAYPNPHDLMQETLTVVEPWVMNGLKEAQTISVEHALREAAAVSYLIGKGYNPNVAHQIVESWWHK
jgi:hypothetical protein